MPPPTSLKSISVQFKRRESERAQAVRQQSHSFLKQMDEDEQWVELKSKVKTSADAGVARNRMCSGPDTPIAFDVLREEYLSVMHPPSAAPVPPDVAADAVVEGYTAESLRKLPLDEQLATMFKYSTVMTYEGIRGYTGLMSAAAHSELLTALAPVAVMVKGLFFSRPETYYTPPQQSLYEYMLLLFHESATINRTETFGVAKNDVKQLLLQVASARAGGWILKHADEGAAFMRAHPELQTQWDKYWASRRNVVIANFHSQRDSMSVGGDVSMGGGAGAAGAAAGSIGGPSTDIPFPGTNQREQLQNLLVEVLKKDGVCNLQYLRQKLDEAKRSDASPYSLLKEPVENGVFLSVLKSVAAPLHDTYYLKSSGDTNLDKYRNVLVTLFRDKMSVKRLDCNEASQTHLNEPIPQSIWNKLIKEFAYCKNNTWVFKPGNGDMA